MITSPGNEKIKWIRKLQQKKFREETGLGYVEGLRVVGDACQYSAGVEMLIVCEELLKSQFGAALIARERSRGIEVVEVSKPVFESFSLKEHPQGIAAVVKQHWSVLDEVTAEREKPWVVLDSIADPGNLGTIFRSTDGAGGAGVILLDQSTDPYDPVSIRASMGALFNLKICRATLEEFARWKASRGCFVVGTSDAAATDYHRFRYPEYCVLMMGSERQGLRQDHYALCDAVVSIPMLGVSDSLNLAVATSLVLYEALNQRRDRLEGGLPNDRVN
jgi:TrmH family RNA methyltransferase